jgi:hypothetical protein
MDYTIVFSPTLGLTTAEFVAAWNNSADCRSHGEARLAEANRGQFDLSLLPDAVTILGGIALGVASNAIYDLIKGMLVKQSVRKRTEIRQLDQPDVAVCS